MSFVDRFLPSPPPTAANPLATGDSVFADRCAEAGRRYLVEVNEWRRSVGDNPGFTTDPVECCYALAHTCARICGLLVEPRWTRRDVNLLAEYLPVALTNSEFRDLVSGYLTRVILAVQDARR